MAAPVELVGKGEGGDGEPDLLLIDLATTGLSAGSYWLELTVSDPVAATEQRLARAHFRVP